MELILFTSNERMSEAIENVIFYWACVRVHVSSSYKMIETRKENKNTDPSIDYHYDMQHEHIINE